MIPPPTHTQKVTISNCSALLFVISAWFPVLLPHGQGLCDRVTGEDSVSVEEQDHGLEKSLYHTLEQTLYTDHEEDATHVSLYLSSNC